MFVLNDAEYEFVDFDITIVLTTPRKKKVTKTGIVYKKRRTVPPNFLRSFSPYQALNDFLIQESRIWWRSDFIQIVLITAEAVI